MGDPRHGAMLPCCLLAAKAAGLDEVVRGVKELGGGGWEGRLVPLAAGKEPRVLCQEVRPLAEALARLPALDEKPMESSGRILWGTWRRQVTKEAGEALRSWLASDPLLPAALSQLASPGCSPGEGHARRLLCACPVGRFQAIATTWAPGKSAPMQDRAGMWCVEALYRGRILEQAWSAPAPAEGDATPAEAVRFPPPGAWEEQARNHVRTVEYVAQSNPFEEPAVVIHIYGGRPGSYCAFHPLEEGAGRHGGLHRRERCDLHLQDFAEERAAAAGSEGRGKGKKLAVKNKIKKKGKPSILGKYAT